MPNTIKSELQIYDEINGVVKSALEFFGVSGWQVMQWAQPSFQGLKSPVILTDLYDTKRYGWTYTKYVWDRETQTGEGIISWLKEIYFSFTFWKGAGSMASAENLKEYETALDAANKVLAYFQSEYGFKKLFDLGYNSLITAKIYNPPIVSDSDRYTRAPVIRIKFIIKENATIDETSNFITEQEQQLAFDNQKIEIKEV